MTRNLPQTHEVDAKQLRTLHRFIDHLAFLRHQKPMDTDVAQAIDRVVMMWGPLQKEVVAQHARHIGGGHVSDCK